MNRTKLLNTFLTLSVEMISKLLQKFEKSKHVAWAVLIMSFQKEECSYLRISGWITQAFSGKSLLHTVSSFKLSSALRERSRN